jgi:signal peptidase I
MGAEPLPVDPLRRVNRRLIVAGFILAGLALVLGPFAAVPAIVIGIVVIVRGRGAAGGAIIATAVVLWATMAAILFGVLDARAFRVPSESMEPTLEVGDRLVVTKVSEPSRGDIVIFNPPLGAMTAECGVEHSRASACPRPTERPVDLPFIKRVVAVGGDRLSIRGGRVYLNGERQDEPFARAGRCGPCNLPREITVPQGHLFLLGDNRTASADSREFGPVPDDWVIGAVRLRYWPPGSAGLP